MIVITGVSSGLGEELANLLKSSGKQVVGLSRKPSIQGIEHIPTDLRDERSINNACKKILAMHDPLEALINCAGVLSVEKVESITVAEINKVLDTNIRAPLLLTSRLMKRIKTDGTDIVNVASTVGLKGYADQAAYGSSKWAIRGFSANLQTELKDTSCRVISFCPGGFKSKLFLTATGFDNTLNPKEWMSAKDLSHLIKTILDLPKNMEVSEIIVNRKVIK